MGKKNSLLFFVLLFLLFAIVAPFTAIPVKASQDSSGFPSITIESYTVGGVTTYYSGGSIPVGAVIDFRVWVDLYNIDPVRIGYGDGTSDSYSFGGSFSHDFYHAYDEANTYVAEAFMPTDSGTFTGYSPPITIGSESSGGSSFPSFLSNDTVTVGIVATVIIVLFFGIAVSQVKTAHAKSKKDRSKSIENQTVYIGEGTTPQLLRSPEADKQGAKGSDVECKNLKAVWDDDKKKAEFAKGLESAARARFARDLQNLPEDLWKKCLEYIKDQAKDRVQELTEDAIIAFFVAVPEVEILTHVFVEVSKYMTEGEVEPGLFEKLVNDYNSVVNTHAEATRLAELADFRFNEYKTRCL